MAFFLCSHHGCQQLWPATSLRLHEPFTSVFWAQSPRFLLIRQAWVTCPLLNQSLGQVGGGFEWLQLGVYYSYASTDGRTESYVIMWTNKREALRKFGRLWMPGKQQEIACWNTVNLQTSWVTSMQALVTIKTSACSPVSPEYGIRWQFILHWVQEKVKRLHRQSVWPLMSDLYTLANSQ